MQDARIYHVTCHVARSGRRLARKGGRVGCEWNEVSCRVAGRACVFLGNDARRVEETHTLSE